MTQNVQICLIVVYFSYPLIFLCILFLFVLFLRKTQLALRKATVYVCISTIGQCFLFYTNLAVIQPKAPLSIWGSFVLHYLGIAVLTWPLLFRGWRIVCLFTRTFDCPVQISSDPFRLRFQIRKVGSLTRKKRGHRWMMLRFWTAMLPSILILGVWSIIVAVKGQEEIQYFNGSWSTVLDAQELLGGVGCLSTAVALCYLRRRVTERELVETRALVAFSVALLVFLTFDLVGWYGFVSNGDWSGEEFAATKIYILVVVFASSAGVQTVLQLQRIFQRDRDRSSSLSTTQGSTLELTTYPSVSDSVL